MPASSGLMSCQIRLKLETVSHARANKVDAPDGEHDLEDVEEHHRGVESIILTASMFEKPDQVMKQQMMRTETLKKQVRDLEGDM